MTLRHRLPTRPLAALLSACIASSAVAFTADELAARNVAAKGGIENLHALRALELSGTLKSVDGVEYAFTARVKPPLAVRFEAGLEGLTRIKAYDGREAWQVNPFAGRKDPERLSADDARDLAEDAADFLGALIGYREKGYTLDYLGLEDVDGTEAHKLRVTRPNGNTTYVYLDPEHFLEIRTVDRRIEHGVPRETLTDYGDYEQVGGVWFAFAQELGTPGSDERSEIQFDKAQANTALADGLFAIPAAPAAGGK